MSVTDTTENAVRRASEPSLRITDIRVATIQAQGIHPILKIDTNQGVYGLGEVRDGAHPDTAMRLKPLLIGQNPCNVEYLFRRIKRYGGESREAGGSAPSRSRLWISSEKYTECRATSCSAGNSATRCGSTAIRRRQPIQPPRHSPRWSVRDASWD